MIFSIQRVKGQLHPGIIMFCKNTVLAIIQHNESGTEGEFVSILLYYVFSDTELVILIMILRSDQLKFNRCNKKYYHVILLCDCLCPHTVLKLAFG